MNNKIHEAENDQVENNYDDLASFIMKSFDRARSHRDQIGVTQSIKDSLQRYRSKYSNEEREKFSGIDIYVPMTNMMVRSAYSWLKDAYFNAQDKPWTLEPTPIPELPDFLQKDLDMAIENQIMNTLDPNMMMGMRQPDTSKKKLIDQLRNTASKMAFEYASESIKGMSTVIEDQLQQAQFRIILSDFLLDLLIYPYAVIKGPVIRNKKTPMWKKDRYVFENKTSYYLERVDPRNFWFSPDSTDTQDGEFVIELSPMGKSNLLSAKKMKNFKSEAINLVIEENDYRYNRQAELRVDDSDYEKLDGVGRDSDSTDGYVFDVYCYHGQISGHHILEFIDMEKESDEAVKNFDTVETNTEWGVIDPYESYEVETWVCNDRVLMVRPRAESPIPYRPYYTTSCFKIPGSPYGESIPIVIADSQDELNTSARARAYNVGMSSGPIVEADISRMPDNKVPEQIRPWLVYPVQSNNTQANNSSPALRFNTVPDNSISLTRNMIDVWERAHSIAGIPPYMYGENKGSAQTLGAFSLQYAGATKGIKTIISNIDHDIIEKLITQMYYYNMIYHEDKGIKSDAKVNVRGSAGLIAQEQRQARPLELLQALGPILAQMQPETALALANETLSESGYDPANLKSGINSSNAEKEASSRLVGGNTQAPPTDGRSGNVEQISNGAQMPIQT